MSYNIENITMVKDFGGVPRSRMATDHTPPVEGIDPTPLTLENVRERTDAAIAHVTPYPTGCKGQGIVIPGGGRYFASAYVLVKMLRQQGCVLPIELWYLGRAEMTDEMIAAVSPYNVECIDAHDVRKTHPIRLLNGWELKAFAIVHSRFEEVMLLDADNLPVMEPTYLFENSQYLQGGAIFWPDVSRSPGDSSYKPAIWHALGIEPPLGLPEFESAQIVMHKKKCWKPLALALWFNAHSDFFYQYMFGDKETFNLAWRKLRAPFAMPSMHIHHLRNTLCQLDFGGQRLFQHRCNAKFDIKWNVAEEGFLLESDCLIHLADLAAKWDGRIQPVPRLDFARYAPAELQEAVEALVTQRHRYTRVGFDSRSMRFLRNGTIGEGSAFYEHFWDVRLSELGEVHLHMSSASKQTCRFTLQGMGVWHGRWEHSGEMSVELRPI